MAAQLKGRWTPENRAALEALLTTPFAQPPIAIFDWDHTSVRGDIANVVFHELCRDLAFHFDTPEFDAWLDELPVPTRIAECYARWRARPSRETRAALRFELERTRWTLHDTEDDNQAWAWDSGAFVGWTPSQVREYARRVIARELAQPLAQEVLVGEDSLRLELGRGLRLRPEIGELIYEMRRAGWLVYVISASPQWAVEAAAERYSLAPENVIAMRRSISNGRITAALEPPVSWGDGKVDAYQAFVTRARPPNFVAGDSIGDWKVLEWATDCALLVEPTRDPLRQYALWKKSLGETWLIQNFGNGH